jgi:hypothetical protein
MPFRLCSRWPAIATGDKASAAVAAAMKQAGEEAEAKTLMRLGLRDLAR